MKKDQRALHQRILEGLENQTPAGEPYSQERIQMILRRNGKGINWRCTIHSIVVQNKDLMKFAILSSVTVHERPLSYLTFTFHASVFSTKMTFTCPVVFIFLHFLISPLDCKFQRKLHFLLPVSSVTNYSVKEGRVISLTLYCYIKIKLELISQPGVHSIWYH